MKDERTEKNGFRSLFSFFPSSCLFFLLFEQQTIHFSNYDDSMKHVKKEFLPIMLLLVLVLSTKTEFFFAVYFVFLMFFTQFWAPLFLLTQRPKMSWQIKEMSTEIKNIWNTPWTVFSAHENDVESIQSSAAQNRRTTGVDNFSQVTTSHLIIPRKFEETKKQRTLEWQSTERKLYCWFILNM